MTQQLNEMGEITRKDAGFSFTVWVHSDDHNPPHMHFLDKNNDKLITKIEITLNYPATTNDIKILKGYPRPSEKILKEVLKWAYTKNKRGWEYWEVAQEAWEQLHPNEPIEY